MFSFFTFGDVINASTWYISVRDVSSHVSTYKLHANVLLFVVVDRLWRPLEDGGEGWLLTWALTTSPRARSTSLTADGGWSPVEARSAWSASSATVTDKAAARFAVAVAYSLHSENRPVISGVVSGLISWRSPGPSLSNVPSSIQSRHCTWTRT